MNKNNKLREYNMDLERVLLIFMVIVLHYNNRAMGGALEYASQAGGVVQMLVRFSQSLSICAVDAFLILSGFFGGTSRVRKCVWLLISCSFYRVVAYLIYALRIEGALSVKTLIAYLIPSNWFVCMFVTVMLLSPYVNKLMEILDSKKRRELVMILTVVFCLVPSVVNLCQDIVGVNLSGLATVTLNGDINGFTVVCFLYCYILGYWIRGEKDSFQKRPGLVYLAVYVVAAGVSTLISYRGESVWSYTSVLTVIEAVSLTLFFSRLKITSAALGRVLGEIGGCGLGIFVWHTMPLMIFGYWVHLGIDGIVTGNTGSYIGNFWLATLSMYGLSLVWVYVCRCIVKRVSNMYI